MRWRDAGCMSTLCCGLAGCGRPSSLSASGDAGGALNDASARVTAVPDATTVHVPPPFPSEGPFEGSIAWTVTGTKPLIVVLRVKGAKMRIESAGASTYTIRDLADSTEVTVSPVARTVTRKTTAAADLLTTPALVLRPEATGQIDRVAGYACEVYRYHLTATDTGDCCMTTGIPYGVEDPDGRSSERSAVADLFSLRTRATDRAGEEKTRIEVTRIESKALDPSLFIVPPGYRTVAQPGLQR